MSESKYVLLIRLSAEKADAAAERMRRAQANLANAQNKLSQLNAFLAEYRQRLCDGGMEGMSIARWQDWRLFLARLDEAVVVQQRDVDRATQHFVLERHAWQEARKRLKAFEKLLERENEKQRAATARREQKTTDEFAARRFWDRTHGEEE
ncbi:flagellar export protein FliJ [Paludibacterium paludis]|uniref:Flagellar FliJ protein n=1 Tax=Paludibacterium paludis TaxID=1225769 RepID=A0A918P105_9NEIS|nr:flagellar export protein FliJ [Paludibacterium paludis]GGY11031.1 hypothetical protein GCM10011289_12360 [Paludibacterium paludis]